MKKRLLVALIISLTTLGFSQDIDQVITLKGDTISGKVIISTSDPVVQTISIKNDTGRNIFKVYEVKVVTKGDDIYRTIKIDGKYQLGLVVKEGYLSLYRYVSSDPSAQNDFTESILIKRDGDHRVVPKLGFRNQMKDFLGDCETVEQSLNDKMYGRGELIKLIEDYNKCLEEKTQAISRGETTTNLNPDKTLLIKTLISQIKSDQTIQDRESLLEMLHDLDFKLKRNNPIPNYLKSALEEAVKNNTGFTEQLNKILEQ